MTQVAVRTSLADEFYRSLAVERGLQPCTIEGYRNFVGRFLRHLGSDGSAEGLSRLGVRDVDSFVVSAGRSYSRRSMRPVCTAVRGLLRFLYRKRVLRRDLSVAVIVSVSTLLEAREAVSGHG